jgi:hypothetical protein
MGFGGFGFQGYRDALKCLKTSQNFYIKFNLKLKDLISAFLSKSIFYPKFFLSFFYLKLSFPIKHPLTNRNTEKNVKHSLTFY